MTTVRSLRRLFDGSRRKLAFSIVTSVVQSVLLLPVALAARYAFNTLIPHDRVGRLALVTGAVLVLYVLSSGVALWNRWVTLEVTKRAMTRVRAAMLDKLHALPRSWFDRHDMATIHSTVVQDSERLDLMLTVLLAQVVPAAIIGAVLTAMLIAISPLLFAVMLPVALLLVVVNAWLGRSIKRRARALQRAVDACSGGTMLTLRSMTLARAQALEPGVLRRSRLDLDVLEDAARAVGWRSALYALMQGAIAATGGAALLVVGGAAVVSHDLRLGDLVAFFAVAILLRGQLAVAALNLPSVFTGSQSLARIQDLLDEHEPEPYAGSRAIEFQGGIELDDVEFGYTNEPVLRCANVAVEPGEWVALLGPNGAGKTTVINLLLGLYRPASGCVRADGLPFDELDLRPVRERVGALLHEPLIFPGSIADNIAYGRPDADHERIEWAASVAAVTEFAARLPDGLDTLAGDEGLRLSAGQRQRVALARALVREPALLLLDEPTDHLDEASSRLVLENLRRLPGEPAMLLVTHDPAVARRADRAYRLVEGRLVAAGELASHPA
ncbi:MAG: ABC transporter ATP-binding protein [Actinobacteria bacterium]|nr:ABC transporter ATP-binding protein [Actinomycetota bacterium]